MSERRYNESEVAAIFERATQAQTGQRQLPSGEGMTLSELQEIGREVGIAPDLVARAAHAISRAGRPFTRRFVGFPIGVGRTIELDRRLTDTEWEMLVVDLRETFEARGVLRQDGTLRQWTNGNLQALLEPTPTGHRVRLRTRKGTAFTQMAVGLAMAGISVAQMVLVSLGRGDANMASLGTLMAVGVGLFAAGALRLPAWARTRSRQMEEIAARLAASTEKAMP